ncbi:unnamed protein product [Choristocarpus tenellus]
MRIITGDETGLIKVVQVETGKCLAVSAGEQLRSRGARVLCWGHKDQRQDKPDFSHVHVGRNAGVVETWDVMSSTESDKVEDSCNLTLVESLGCQADLVSLACLSTQGGNRECYRLASCGTQGEVQVREVGNDTMDVEPTTFSVRGPISAAFIHGDGKEGVLVAGGKENDLATWDLQTKQCSWKAKNVPHDFLDLRQPVWVTAVQPVSPTEGVTRLVAGTAHRQVRLYDTRAGRRPTHSVDADEHSIRSLVVNRSGNEVIAADTAGLVRLLDLRQLRWGRRFAGPAGSVRSMALHPTLPVMACVGLDRTARVYDVQNGTELCNVYLKQRLNAVLFDAEEGLKTTSGKQGGAKRYSNEESDSEDEGWGSGEEYEMDEGVSSEEEGEEHKERTRECVFKGRGQGSDESSSDEIGSDEDMGGSDDEDEGCHISQKESESEEQGTAPPKRRKSAQSLPSKSKRKLV